MRLVFPHLAEYFIWPDLTVRPMGGTSGMIQTVKALMSVGVDARVIAICDNDSEGRKAVAEIRRLGLPSHVHAMCYPNIASATSWPSVGPHGVQYSDLNGRGCSLELYYGTDVLGTGANRTPVHWTKNGNEWHAAIQDKDKLKSAFLRKIAESSPGALVGDWSDMRALLRSMMFLVTNPPGQYEDPL
jgi:hypothetical protein